MNNQPIPSTYSNNVAYKALVVDDSLPQRLLLGHLLENLGFDVTSAKDGKDCITKFNESQPDIVFMDIEMPIMGGIETVRIIRKQLGENFIPIIFITGGSSDKYLDECIDAGGDDFITKPFNASILSAKARSLLRIKQLYNNQITQKREIKQFKEAEDQEHQTASELYKNIVKSGFMKSPNLRSFLSPMSMFNGDILLCAYTPANKLNILLGDFTGHGITASVAAAPASEIFYGMTAKGFGIREITEEVNTKLKRLLPSHMFLAATILCLDRENHNLSTITCGLPDHFLFDKKNGEIKTITSKNIPLGIVNSTELSFIEEHAEVRSSQCLIMFSDGVIEAENQAGEQFDFDGVKNCLTVGSHSCYKDILSKLEAHQGALGQQDDITLVRLQCDFEPSKWAAHSDGVAKVTIEASNWKTSSAIDYNTLKRINPVPAIVNAIMEIQGLTPYREPIFLVVTELFINSLDHGLLGLKSSLKSSPDGFARFFDLRQQRIDELSEGNITFIFTHAPYKNGGKLIISIQDTGCGFKEEDIPLGTDNNVSFSGRGIQLIRKICDSLEYSNGGRHATAIFTWTND